MSSLSESLLSDDAAFLVTGFGTGLATGVVFCGVSSSDESESDELCFLAAFVVKLVGVAKKEIIILIERHQSG